MSPLCFIDTETTGLNPALHQPYEVCIWREDSEEPVTLRLPHTLAHADQFALGVGGYFEREFRPFLESADGYATTRLIDLLEGVTLVGSNPAFDAAMLTRFIGTPVWHHRMIDVSNVAMVVFDLGRPEGLAGVAGRVRYAGYEVPEPDHTAEGDVRTTRAVYEALREIRRAT